MSGGQHIIKAEISFITRVKELVFVNWAARKFSQSLVKLLSWPIIFSTMLPVDDLVLLGWTKVANLAESVKMIATDVRKYSWPVYTRFVFLHDACIHSAGFDIHAGLVAAGFHTCFEQRYSCKLMWSLKLLWEMTIFAMKNRCIAYVRFLAGRAIFPTLWWIFGQSFLVLLIILTLWTKLALNHGTIPLIFPICFTFIWSTVS